MSEPDTETSREPWARSIARLGGGLVGGLALGSLARLWMRLIAEDPEFTWSGTLGIVIGFAIFGSTQALAVTARRRSRKRRAITVARVVGAIGMLPLFVAAGGVMLPTVVGAGLGIWRDDWPRWLRGMLLLIALGPVVFVSVDLRGSFGWSLRTLLGVVCLIALYSVIVRSTQSTLSPLADGWHMSRHRKVLVGFGASALVLVPLVLGGIN